MIPIWKKSREKTVFFLHIPKCAGSTLIEDIIKKKFKYRELVIFYDQGPFEIIDRLKRMTDKEQKYLKCICGHFYFGVHRYYDAHPTTYITLLRDPIDRVISHYYFVLRSKSHYLFQIAKENRMTLKEYVNRNLSIELNNGQTRILAGLEWDAPFGECSPLMLDQAKENLEKFFIAVGISDRFDEFLQLLNHKIGWEIPNYNKKNVTKGRLKKEEVGKDTIKIIEQYNYLDIKLYRYAKTLFEKQMQEFQY